VVRRERMRGHFMGGILKLFRPSLNSDFVARMSASEIRDSRMSP
jgi:hypothetical protein